jgi:hypothetical protein
MLSKQLIASNEFELFYLIELAKKKIKPLSRWEKPISEAVRQYIRDQGLYLDVIGRKTSLRFNVYETIFSHSSHYLDFYRKKFDHSLLCKDDRTKQLEGFLFGYPYCCVKQFIQKPYIKNSLIKKEQSLLFHWACPGCRVTPGLIPYYRSIHDQVAEWYRINTAADRRKEQIHIQQYRRKFQTILAALLFSAGLLSGKTNSGISHFIPLPDDINHNGLSYAEEVYLGSYTYGLEEDCQKYAMYFKTIIDSLPDSVKTDQTYKIEHRQRGVVPCPICGEYINMGYVQIVNPLRNLEINIPFLGLHFMENGYFSYGSNESSERVDIDTLKRILYPYDPQHLLPVTGDSDGDGLTDSEEDSLRLNPNNIDSDGDGVPDGAQIAEQLVRLYPQLKETVDPIHSYIQLHLTWGTESCHICGSFHNMGFIEIINPENKRSCQLPFLGLHTLAHGSFAFDGDVHQNQRINAVELFRTIKTHSPFIVNDSDNDGLKDNEEEYFGFSPNQADSDGDGILDGMELALTMVNKIESLPTEPGETEPYVIHNHANGIYNCPLCGEGIDMGFMEIHNPLIVIPANQLPYFHLTYYAYHFMRKGSFAYEGVFSGRTDPIELAYFLNINPCAIKTEGPEQVVDNFKLEQNYPNPFNPSTTIRYHLPVSNYITLTIYNTAGQKIAVLVNNYQKAGEHEINWTANGLPSGIYFYQLQAGGYSESKKLVLLK